MEEREVDGDVVGDIEGEKEEGDIMLPKLMGGDGVPVDVPLGRAIMLIIFHITVDIESATHPENVLDLIG